MPLTKIHKLFIMLGIAAIIVGLALPTRAFTQKTIEYYTLKAFPNQQCQESLLEAIQDAYNPNKWIENTDLLPKNTTCEQKDSNCLARYYADQYKQKAINETSICKSVQQKGTMAYFYLNTYNPANWQPTPQGCKDQFNTKIENKIRERSTIFQIRQECLIDQNTTMALGYSNEDQNTTIQNLKQYWEKTTELLPEEKRKAETTAKKMYEIIQQNLKEGEPTQKQLDITTEIILGMEKYDCLIAKEDETKLYEGWKTLTDIEKNCLPIFLTGQETNYWEFTTQCPHFQANPNDFMQFGFAAANANFALVKYFDTGFAERKCQNLQPTQNPTPTQTTTNIPICYYTPKNLLGCIKEFQNKQLEAASVWEDAQTDTIAWLLAGGLLIWMIIAFTAQKAP